MTPSQEKHLKEILVVAHALLIEKYKRGAEEHHGDLLDMPALELLDNAIDENIDQFVYLITARQKLHEYKSRGLSRLDADGEYPVQNKLQPLPDFPADEILSEGSD